MLDTRDAEIARLRSALAEANAALKREADEHARAEAILQSALAQLNEAQRLSKTGSYTADLAKDEVVWSNELYRIYDLELGSKITVQRAVDFVHPEDMPEFQVALERASRGIASDFIFRIITPKGATKYLRTLGKIDAKPDGGFELIGGVQDVTESQLAQDALKKNEARLRSALAHLNEAQALSSTGSFTVDLLKDEHIWSDGFYRICDLEPGSEVTIQRFVDLIHPDDRTAAQKIVDDEIRGAHRREIEFRIVTPKGVVKHLRLVGNIAGQAGQIVGAVQDITEATRAKAALVASEKLLSETIDTIPVNVGCFSTLGTIKFSNKPWLDYIGLSAEQALGVGWRAVVHPEDERRVNEAWKDMWATGHGAELEIRVRRHDGEYRWFSLRTAPQRNDLGEIVRWYATYTDIHERKRAEHALADSERILRETINTIPVMVVCNSVNGLMEATNQQWLDYTGLSTEQAVGVGFQAAFHPDDLSRLMKAWRRMMKTGVGGQQEGRIRRYDGEYRWFSLHTAPLRDDAGKILRWYSTNTDIHDRKKAEEALTASERNLRQTIDAVPAIVFCNNAEGPNEFLNQRWHDYTGISADDAAGRGWQTPLHPDDLPELMAAWAAMLKDGEGGEVEGRMRRADGVYRWFAFRTDALRDETGKVVKWYGTVNDIDDRKQAEKELRRAYNSFADAQRLSQTGSFIADIVTDEYTCSDEAYRIFEYELGSKVTTRRIRESVHPEDRERFDLARDRGFSGIAGDEFLFRIVTESGATKYVRALGHLVDVGEGYPSLVGAVQDVTESKLVEGALRRSEAILAHGEVVSETGSFRWNLEADEIRWSHQLYRIFEFEPDSPITLERIGERVHPQDREMFSEMMSRAYSGLNSEHEHRLLMPDGSIKYLHFVGQSSRDPEGRLEYMGSVQEITGRKAAEQELDRVRSELTHAARAMSLGVLTASLAHEVSQPLAGIITNANTCLRMLSSDTPNVLGALETARRTIRDGNRASDVVSRLRALFSKKAFAVEAVDLTDAVREVLALSAHDLQRRYVAVVTEFPKAPLEVAGDRVQIQQVILNLVLNACDAVEGIEDRPRIILVRTGEDGEGFGRVTVRDTGVGVTEETLAKIFNAFYTTKPDGMGIGLSISRSIIERHRGRLWAEPNDGPGATFSFSIPVSAQSA